MTDPRTLQRQLLHAQERADELEASLDRIAKLCAPLLVHHSMVHEFDKRITALESLTPGAQAILVRSKQK